MGLAEELCTIRCISQGDYGIWVVLNPVESCIVSPLWHSEYPSVGLKVLLLTLMLPQHTVKINRSDRHEPCMDEPVTVRHDKDSHPVLIYEGFV